MDIYVKEDIDDIRVVYKDNSKNIQILSTIIGNLTVKNMYKPKNNN